MMTCQRMQDLVHAYLDGELSLTEQLSFEQHLATCPQCEQAHHQFAKLNDDLKQSGLRFDLPERLAEKLRRTLPQSRQRTRAPMFWRPLAIAAMVAIVLLAGALALVSRPRPAEFAQDFVDAHVRSLQADHLTDVASTDQHTVKPWFDGKLDFAPPVRDLAAQGFPLIGGRLDYIQNHPVAALVYQRRKHVINVFVWPESGADEAVKESTTNGYHSLEWREGGMRSVAVSDLQMSEMEDLAKLLREK